MRQERVKRVELLTRSTALTCTRLGRCVWRRVASTMHLSWRHVVFWNGWNWNRRV